MQFVYHPHAGLETLIVDTREYEHLFKVRRLGVGETLMWRNLDDTNVYEYAITQIGKKEATLSLVSQQTLVVAPSRLLHVGWCVIDPKIIEKTLPMLNELGVSKISFVYAEFSQKSHKLDMDRIKRILINSSQQCGRSDWLKIEVLTSLQAYIEAYPQSHVIDFSKSTLQGDEAITSVLIGPEGGFSSKERMMFQQERVLGFTCKTILRSETAVVTAVSKIVA